LGGPTGTGRGKIQLEVASAGKNVAKSYADWGVGCNKMWGTMKRGESWSFSKREERRGKRVLNGKNRKRKKTMGC